MFTAIWKESLIKQTDRYGVRSVCFKPDQSELIAACSNDLFFIDYKTGIVKEQKRAHQAPINFVRCSFDGTYLASASSDGSVVIWRGANNEGFLQFGPASSIKSMAWSPNKQVLIACAEKEYDIWKPDDSRSNRIVSQVPIELVAFSSDGEFYSLSYSTGAIQILSVETQEIVQTYQSNSMVTVMKFFNMDNEEYFITSDLDRRVSMFRVSDKALVGKNTLPFEATCCEVIEFNDKFFLFAGISGEVSLFTSQFSFLDTYKSDSDFIWDIAVNQLGQIALGCKSGELELRSIDFPLSTAAAGDYIASKVSLNSYVMKNIFTKEETVMTFNKVLMSIKMSQRYTLLQFHDSLSIYQQQDRVYEIPGSFDESLLAVTKIHIVEARNNMLEFLDLTGNPLYQFEFRSRILYLSAAPAFTDGAYVSCEDGRIYFVMIDKKTPVLLKHHEKPVVFVTRSYDSLAYIDSCKRCYIDDKVVDNVSSFAFSDRIKGLYAVSDGECVTVFYRSCHSLQLFIEGQVIGFTKNKLLITNLGSIEIVDIELPLEELIQNEQWDDLLDLLLLDLPKKQIQQIVYSALEKKKYDVVRILAPIVDPKLAFYVRLVLPAIPEEKESEPQLDEEALQRFADSNDWKSLLKFAKEKNLQRVISDFVFPEDVAEDAAQMMLDAGYSESAIPILQQPKSFNGLARAHVYLGQWTDAITLSKLHPSVYNLVYPRFAELLFESGSWFESLVCLFIPTDSILRENVIHEMITNSAVTHCANELSFFSFCDALNTPQFYWEMMNLSFAYLAVHRIRQFKFMPLNESDLEELFNLSYFAAAVIKSTPMIGVNYSDIFTALAISSSSSSICDKTAFDYALNNLQVNNSNRALLNRISKFTPKQHSYKCPNCAFDLFSSPVPVLCCPNCGNRMLFSSWSMRPLPLIRYTTREHNYKELITMEPEEGENNVFDKFTATSEWLANTGPEYHVIQSMKEKSGVRDQLSFNPSRISVHTCHVCGSLFDEVDYERGCMSTGCCPICKNSTVPEYESEILELLRSFEEDSPVPF